MSDHLNLLLVGAGAMAVEYARVLTALDVSFVAVGRGERSARAFAEATGVTAATGGLTPWIVREQRPIEAAIVATSGDQLASATVALLGHGVRRILVEKPGGVHGADIRDVARAAAASGGDVRVAYNRRFYASTRRAREIIAADGGPTSLHFDFTEWWHHVAALEHAPGVLASWLLANSTHVVDTAFFLAGAPVELSAHTSGDLASGNPTVYAGSGTTATGALFSYIADWQAPGSWGIEVMTRKHRLILRPLERLALQKIGSRDVETVALDDELDHRFKPGLHRETAAFLSGIPDGPPSIGEHLHHLAWYERISRGTAPSASPAPPR